ncbi:hypothetical protein HanPSC8_Chr10g0429381 [Helianthus annuus]|nr:hypothetical protein HanPSC8_Chr10g0429381 [Helianthus annuus]
MWEWIRNPESDAELHQVAGLNSLLENVVVTINKDRWIWNGAEKEDFTVATLRYKIPKQKIVTVDSREQLGPA